MIQAPPWVATMFSDWKVPESHINISVLPWNGPWEAYFLGNIFWEWEKPNKLCIFNILEEKCYCNTLTPVQND